MALREVVFRLSGNESQRPPPEGDGLFVLLVVPARAPSPVDICQHELVINHEASACGFG